MIHVKQQYSTYTNNDNEIDRNAHYPPHTHSTLTTHLILRGSLTIHFPQNDEIDDVHDNDEKLAKTTTTSAAMNRGKGKGKGKERKGMTYGVGERIDVDAGREHEVWIAGSGSGSLIGAGAGAREGEGGEGGGGCEYVIGEM